jgi:hypothetical protein
MVGENEWRGEKRMMEREKRQILLSLKLFRSLQKNMGALAPPCTTPWQFEPKILFKLMMSNDITYPF